MSLLLTGSGEGEREEEEELRGVGIEDAALREERGEFPVELWKYALASGDTLY